MTPTRLRWLANIYAGGTPAKDVPAYWREGSIPWLNSGAVNDWTITKPSALISVEGYRNSSAKWIPRGAVVVALAGQGKTKGMAARLEFASTCNQSMAAIVPGDRLDYRYLHLTLAGRYQELRNMSGGEQRDGLNLQHIGDITLPVLPIDEQRRIADFLDDQVARIDNIIAARLRQKELLGRLATEVIRNAIQEPHAALAPLSAVVGWLEGPGILAKDFREEGVPILRIAQLRAVPPSLEGCNFVDEAEARGRWRHFLTEIGELIVSGSATVGELAVWVTEEIRDAIPYTGLIKLRPRPGLDPDYMRSFFISRVFGEQIDLLKSGIGIQHWGPSHLSQVRIPVPAMAIQREVATGVARVEAYVSAGADLIDRLLEELDTLKRSLITAAVTGEFDVSGADGSRVAV